MPRIIFILADGTQRTVDAVVGDTAMLAATRNNVPGILGECGGACSCATCHVYVDDAWAGRLPAPGPFEQELLPHTAAERRPNSRLGCQIDLTMALDGLVLHMPAAQA